MLCRQTPRRLVNFISGGNNPCRPGWWNLNILVYCWLATHVRGWRWLAGWRLLAGNSPGARAEWAGPDYISTIWQFKYPIQLLSRGLPLALKYRDIKICHTPSDSRSIPDAQPYLYKVSTNKTLSFCFWVQFDSILSQFNQKCFVWEYFLRTLFSFSF